VGPLQVILAPDTSSRPYSHVEAEGRRCLRLTADDLKASQLGVLKLTQHESFPKDFHCLAREQKLLSSSRIIHLAPFIDAAGILRAKGRTRKAPSLQYSAKHPIILDSKHPAVKLFLLRIHRQNHHQGVEYLRSIIQHEFWILHLRSTLRLQKTSCVICRRRAASFAQLEMSDLPEERLTDRCYPFANVGIDYFGPL
jgi:hypothetical protein